MKANKDKYKIIKLTTPDKKQKQKRRKEGILYPDFITICKKILSD